MTMEGERFGRSKQFETVGDLLGFRGLFSLKRLYQNSRVVGTYFFKLSSAKAQTRK